MKEGLQWPCPTPGSHPKLAREYRQYDKLNVLQMSV